VSVKLAGDAVGEVVLRDTARTVRVGANGWASRSKLTNRKPSHLDSRLRPH
jgi:hypothetical protein